MTCSNQTIFGHDWLYSDGSKPTTIIHEDVEADKLVCSVCSLRAWSVRYAGKDEFGLVPQMWCADRLVYSGPEPEYDGKPLLVVRWLKQQKAKFVTV